MTLAQPGLFETPPVGPEEFVYQPDFLATEEEARLADALAGLPFEAFEFHGFLGKRRIVSFGWRYVFDGSGLRAAAPIPPFLADVRDRAARLAGREPAAFEHALVTEYAPGAGIGWHRDRPVFGDVVAITLLAPARLRFRRKAEGGGWQRMAVIAAPRSAYLLRGPAREIWEHSIPPVERLRYSITFRTLRDALSSRRA